MSWTKFFDRIVLINLPERTDRLLRSTEVLSNYGIEFELVNGMRGTSGAEGLKDTMNKLFEECIMNGVQNLLVFEDDIELYDDVHGTMNAAIEQLPSNYRLLYMGLQPAAGFSNFFSPNLLPIKAGYATHACAYSNRAMSECIGQLQSPIDNWLVQELQERGDCYVTYPMIATQRPDMSDIGGQYIDWSSFLQQKYEIEISRLKSICNR